MRSKALLAWLWLLLFCSAARAQVEPRDESSATSGEEASSFASALRVEVISCVLEESAVDVTEMLAIARAELAPHILVRSGEKNSQPLLRVDACHDERLVLRLLSPEGPEQSVALHDVPPEHRPRVAALALAELVLTARTLSEWRAERAAKGEAGSDKPPKPTSPKPVSSANSARLPDWSENQPAEPQRNTLGLGLGSDVRLFLESLSLSYGPRLSLRLARAELGLVALIGRRNVELGELRTGVVALSAAVHLWQSRGAVAVAVSLGTEVGVSWGRAEPHATTVGEDTEKQAQFASLFSQLTVGGAISDQAYARAGLAIGYALGVHAKIDGDEISTLGVFSGLSLAIGWLL